MKKEQFILILGFVVAIIFRIWFISLSPQPFRFDQFEYYDFALNMLNHGIFASSARLYGYPLFQAILFKIFSTNSIQPIIIFQILLDSLTAIVIYQWAKLLFRQRTIPLIAFLLYVFNPYTSAYVGVTLSEITGIFFASFTLYLFTLFWLKKQLHVYLLFSITAGFLPQIRPVFLYFMIGLFILSSYHYWKKKVIILGILLFITPFFYVGLGNIKYFNEWKLTTVDHIPPRELFISIMVPGRAPYHIQNGYDVYPIEVMHLYEEYSVIPKNNEERAVMGNKYLTKALEMIKKDPLLFIQERLGKMFFVWEKHFLFYYQEDPNIIKDRLVYWGNIIILIFGLLGLMTWLIKKRTVLAGVYLLFILYISIIHSVSLAEERYSLPGYPLLFLFVGYLIVLCIENKKKLLRKK